MKKWFKSDKANDQESLEDYCLTHAKKYDKFNNKWIDKIYIKSDSRRFQHIRKKKFWWLKTSKKEDDDNYYFLKIKEMRHEQTLAPLDYVRDEITLILKNKKKLQFETTWKNRSMKKEFVKSM